jgi:hypothetical protein
LEFFRRNVLDVGGDIPGMSEGILEEAGPLSVELA